ncbi:hypothetical protein CYLTODRAFT_389461 [Cylindrobasidium torrendii FP15055 ss-10]|uniref:Thioesterase domain-containing protein n=1 Tax=Cylindrobasidium torrendii FP15055 ss-10 TaxID=1314674 RepID=A0A0D7BP45_9AGAR|nr:hypothetical protein CYLTODRAFT_389461 [Cylindrobasidium torrendii FP15055 ss-10]
MVARSKSVEATSEADPKRWRSVPKAGETVIVLREGEVGEIPLIILHGGSGAIHPFGTLRRKFKTALWGVQVTPDTPLNSLEAQARFYVERIKERQPNGPYRLAAFSASSIILFAMNFILERSEDVVEQFSLIDHFPSSFIAPDMGFDPTPMLRQPSYDISEIFRVFMDHTMATLVAIYRRDSGGRNQKRLDVAEELLKAYHEPGSEVSAFTAFFMKTVLPYMRVVLDFMVDLWSKDPSRTVLDALEQWMSVVRAPVTVYVASHGIHGCISPENKKLWGDYGVQRCLPTARVVHLTAGHFDSLESDILIDDLQVGYFRALARL